MMRRAYSLLALLTSLSLLLAACAAPQAAARRPLRVEWTFWEGDYTLLVALEKGYFEKYGVQVEPIYYEVFNKAVPDLAAAKIDIGLFALSNLLDVTRHTDAVSIAVQDSGGASSIVAAPGINSVADLRGKRIAVTVGTTEELIVRNMLRTGGLAVGDVILVGIPAEEVPGRLPDDIQAGYTWEPFTSQALANGSNLLYSTADSSSLIPDVMVTRRAVLDERPEDIRAFLRAWFEAVDYRLANPVDTRLIAARYLGVSVEDIVLGDAKSYSLAENKALFTERPPEDLSSIYNVAQVSADFLVSIGAVIRRPDPRVLFDPSYLP